MNARFADTFYFIALLNPSDPAHRQAVAFARVPCNLVTTQWVLTELADGLARTPSRQLFAIFLERLRSKPTITIVPASEELFHRAVNLYAQRTDKEWSLTDCTSFLVMRERSLTEALSGDHHFEQAGFLPLLKT